MDRQFAVGIIGPGRIAAKMAHTLRDMDGARLRAVASRDLKRAGDFAAQWGAERAYGSYEEMLDDPDLDLVYIATPHTFHRENALLSIRKGKPVLCEKSFTVNAREAGEMIALAREKKVFVAEAIWTRYLPASQTINEIVASGVIGTPYVLSANLGYPVTHKERVCDPALAGGALLDVGVYPINFAAMVFGTEIESVVSSCTKLPTGVDASNSIAITFSGGRLAVMHSSIVARTDRQGIISGDRGHIIVENINNPTLITVVDNDYRTVASYPAPPQITGFEYQVQAAKDAIRNGLIETPFMTHEETLRIMRLMDDLRREWGVSYPFE
jgi:predicted dehydrogenase